MRPDPYKEEISLTYFFDNVDFAKQVWNELEKTKDECSSWWVKSPAFIKYPMLWENGYRAKKILFHTKH